MRLLAQAGSTAEGFSLAEFDGGEGPWTVPQVHKNTEESFFVLEGGFSFTIDGDEFDAGEGTSFKCPAGRHMSSLVSRAVGEHWCYRSPAD